MRQFREELIDQDGKHQDTADRNIQIIRRNSQIDQTGLQTPDDERANHRTNHGPFAAIQARPSNNYRRQARPCRPTNLHLTHLWIG